MARKVPTTLAMALACARKVASGKPCTMAELKATVNIMKNAYDTRGRSIRELRDRAKFLTDLVKR